MFFPRTTSRLHRQDSGSLTQFFHRQIRQSCALAFFLFCYSTRLISNLFLLIARGENSGTSVCEHYITSRQAGEMCVKFPKCILRVLARKVTSSYLCHSGQAGVAPLQPPKHTFTHINGPHSGAHTCTDRIQPSGRNSDILLPRTMSGS